VRRRDAEARIQIAIGPQSNMSSMIDLVPFYPHGDKQYLHPLLHAHKHGDIMRIEGVFGDAELIAAGSCVGRLHRCKISI